MSRLIVVLILVVGLAAGVAPAAAQQGNGPYSPFPSRLTGSQAEHYYAQLGVDLTSSRVDAGVFRAGLRAARGSGQASHRAGDSGDHSGVPALLGALALAFAGIGLMAVRGRRTPALS